MDDQALVPAPDTRLDRNVGGGAITESKPPFRPSKRQRAYLEAWLDPQAPKTIIAIAKAIGIPRATIHYWLRNPQFTAWFNDEMQRSTDHLWNPALNKLGQLCIQGSAEHMKLFAQIRGAIRGESSTGNSANVGVNVIVGIPRAGDAVDVPREAPRPGLPPARTDSEH